MRFSILGSGSKGNCTLVEHNGTRLLIDAGFSAREIKNRLATKDLLPNQINAIFITHAHSDHSKGAPRLAGAMNIPTFATSKAHMACHKVGGLANWNQLVPGQAMSFGAFTILPIQVPHDSPGTVAFVIEAEGHRLGILTDLGSFNQNIVDHFQNLDVVYLEFNHDLDMLFEGPYPHRLKRRVSSEYGHLNNQQSSDLLGHIASSRLKKVMLAHLSESNNTPELAFHAAQKALVNYPEVKLAVAPQHEPSVWVDVVGPQVDTPSTAAPEAVQGNQGPHQQEEVALAVRHQVALFST